MVICEICKKELKSHRQLNGHLQTHRKSKKQIAYELDPSKCKECYQPISWKTFRKKSTSEFCCVSCRAKFFYKKAQMIEEKRIV